MWKPVKQAEFIQTVANWFSMLADHGQTARIPALRLVGDTSRLIC